MIYEVLGKVFISLLVIGISIPLFWGCVFFFMWLIDARNDNMINILGILIGLIISINYIWL